jgi:hypothetical protein
MSANKPTAHQDDTTAPSPTDYWREKEALAGGPSDDEVEASQVDSKNTEGGGRKRALTRHARIVAVAVLAVLTVALAWVVVPALVGGGSTPQSRPAPEVVHAKAGKADRRGSGRTRWVREPDASPRPRRRHAPEARQVRRRAHPLHQPRRPASPPPEPPSQPPASVTTPPEPSSPATPPPAEPKEKPGLRDGATESAEFGL